MDRPTTETIRRGKLAMARELLGALNEKIGQEEYVLSEPNAGGWYQIIRNEQPISNPLCLADITGVAKALLDVAVMAGVASLPQRPKHAAFKDVADIVAANMSRGFYFFSDDTMRYFETRLYGTVHHGRYFIASNRKDDGARFYVAYAASETGDVRPLVGADDIWAPKHNTYAAAERWINHLVETKQIESFGPQSTGRKSA